MVEEPFLAKGPSLPAFHSSGHYGNPIDTSCFVRNVSANVLEAVSPKQLESSRNVALPFKAIDCGIVAALLQEGRPCHAKAGILRKSPKQKFDILGVEREISVNVTDHIVIAPSSDFARTVKAI